MEVKGDGKLAYHLGADHFHDPDGTMVSQPKKYDEKLKETYIRLFNEEPPKGFKTPLDKNDRPEFDTNRLVVTSSTLPYHTLGKRHNILAYH